MKALGRPQKWTKMWRIGRKFVGARYYVMLNWLHYTTGLWPWKCKKHYARLRFEKKGFLVSTVFISCFLLDLFGLGHKARLKLEDIRSILETLPMVQISSNLGKLTIFRFPTIEHDIRFQLYLVNFWLCLLTPGTYKNFWDL